MSAPSRQGRKGTAQKLAVGSARPDSKARRVTVEMCRSLLGRPDLSDTEAERILEHLYSFADVAVDAFIEQQGRPEEFVIAQGVPVVANPNLTLTSPAAA